MTYVEAEELQALRSEEVKGRMRLNMRLRKRRSKGAKHNVSIRDLIAKRRRSEKLHFWKDPLPCVALGGDSFTAFTLLAWPRGSRIGPKCAVL
jgi:hypothetical protein